MKLEDTPVGIKYDTYVTGPYGAHYVLYPELHHSRKDIKKAKSYIRQNFDPVRINVERWLIPGWRSKKYAVCIV